MADKTDHHANHHAKDFTPINTANLKNAILKGIDPHSLSGSPLENDVIPKGAALKKLSPAEQAAITAYKDDFSRRQKGMDSPALQSALAAAEKVIDQATRELYKDSDSQESKQTFPPSGNENSAKKSR